MCRAAVFGGYGWLDAKGRPLPWPGAFSHVVSGNAIAAIHAHCRSHGTSA